MNLFKIKKFIRNNFDIIFKSLIILLFAFFLLRVFWLDADLPSYGLSYYMPIDEGLYSKMSLNLFNSHSLYNNGNVSFYTAPSYRTNIIGNLLQFIFLNLTGDNYYSFRMPSIIFSILLLFFTLKTIKLICNRNCVSDIKTKIIILAVFFFMSIDFQYLLASRIFENSILRALFLIMTYYFYLKIESLNKKYFITSFLCVCSIFFVYFSNVFVAVPFFVIIIIKLFIEKNKTEAKQIFKYSFLGFILALSLAEAYYLIVWKSGAFYNLFSAISDYSGRLIGSSVNTYNQASNFFEAILYNAYYFFGSNMFIFNFIFEIIAVLSFFYIVFKNKNKLVESEIFLLSFIFGFFIQSLLAADCVERKAFVLYPLLIILIVNTIIHFENLKVTINNLSIIHFLLFGCIILFFAYSCYKTKLYKNHYMDMNINEIKVLALSIIIQTMMFLFILIFLKIKKEKYIVFSAMISIFMLIITNFYFSTKYVYICRTYTEKQVMIDLGNDVGNEKILGPYVYGYTLYNDIIPVSNTVEEYRKYIDNNDAIYYFHYASIDNSPYLNEEIFGKKEPTVALIKSYYRYYRSEGTDKPVGLFKKIE